MSKAWFAAKRFGYGSSWPIAWQGWVALVIFFILVGAATGLLDGLDRLGAILLLVAALVIICALKTEGGWQWRWSRSR